MRHDSWAKLQTTYAEITKVIIKPIDKQIAEMEKQSFHLVTMSFWELKELY